MSCLPGPLHWASRPLNRRWHNDVTRRREGVFETHMNSFREFQSLAAKVPVSLRNNRDRILIPISGLQQETGKVGSLLTSALASGKLDLTADQCGEFKGRMADILWLASVLCEETGVSLQSITEHSLNQLRTRAGELAPDQR